MSNRVLPDNENLSLTAILVAYSETKQTLESDFLPPDEQRLLNDIRSYINKELDVRMSEKEKFIFYPHLEGKI